MRLRFESFTKLPLIRMCNYTISSYDLGMKDEMQNMEMRKYTGLDKIST